MMDPVTILAAGSGAAVSISMLKRLLGPTADYLGERTRDLVKKADENLVRVVGVAFDKLHNDVDLPGEVNPRVFKNVWDESRFVEDPFAAEYFGGLLASARTEDGRDDSALPFVAIVKSLSTYQLRLHFIIYRLIAQYRGKVKDGRLDRFLIGLHLEIPREEVEWSFQVQSDFEAHLLLALNGLVELRLIEANYSIRMGALQRGPYSDRVDGDCLIVAPNERGAVLFLRALGCRGLTAELITAIDVDYGLSSNLLKSLRVPRQFRFFCAAPNDELQALSAEMESLRSEVEEVSEKCDDLESEVDSLTERVDEKDETDEDNED